ncbi:hypothetical protein CK203_048374 [Vitis vinifera]|uniref:Uncharacterized protein n=1 Tax=Vitis vinifera TaxID=29760 RepID=A0A438HRJ1_VITVI|nr:hypothetical protein CK203_048374 [Vitis vinifera]
MLSFSHTLCYHDLNYILQEICDSMIKSMSKSILKKRLGGHCVDIEGCNQDGSGLNKAINYECMSLERLKFENQMVLNNEYEVGEMVVANIWSTNDA